jgi:hypothetical protein
MERGSDKHGPRVDEVLEHEVEGLLRSGHQTRGEEWNEAEPSGEDQPAVSLDPQGLTGGVPDGMTETDVEERSRLASFLPMSLWPATGAQVVAVAAERGAPDDVLARLSYLPSGRSFVNWQEAWVSLHGGVEEHRS